MRTATRPGKPETISVREAMKLLGMSRDRVFKFAALGRIRMVDIPHSFPKVMKSDVLKLAEELSASA